MSNPQKKKPGELSFKLAMKSKKHVTLTLQQRLDILQQLEEGVPLDLLAKQNNVSSVTIRRIQHNATKLRQFSEISGNLVRKRGRKPQLEELDARLHAWYVEERSKGGRITDSILQKKAAELNSAYGGPSSFTASRGWTWRFKVRHNIRVVKPRAEVPDVNSKEAEEFTEKLLRHMDEEDIEVPNIYTMDETRIMWKALPPRVSATVGEKKGQENKVQKDQISVVLCANATGTHKLSPLVIYRYERPKALKHCLDRLPLVFKGQKNGCMDQTLFTDWLENHFQPAVRKEQLQKGYAVGKILLLVDDSLSYIIPPEIQKKDKVEIIFFPKISSSLLQPLHQGVISNVKKSFRLFLLKRLLDFSGNVKEFFVDYDIRDCIDMVNDAWADVTDVSVRNSWQKVIKDRKEEQEADDRARFDKTLAIRDIMCKIVRDDIRLEEIEDWLLYCEDAESYPTAHEEEPNDQKVSLLQDKEKLDNMFKSLLVWANEHTEFVKLSAQLLQNYYN